jgi:RNA polymerase sigma-70 factor, ECF subfamily
MQQDFVIRLRQQDATVIKDLYRAYGKALHDVILRIVHMPDVAEQVLQDSYLKIWRNGTRFDAARGSLFTWMLNIARNTAIDATRSQWFQTTRHALVPLDYATHVPVPLSQDVETAHLMKALSGLNEKYRQVIELLYFQGYTHQEISDEKGIPLGTVKTRSRQALVLLRVQLESLEMLEMVRA